MNVLGTQLFGTNGLLRLAGNLYITDFFDIIIIALFLYSIFILFQRTRTYLIFIGSFFIIILYLIANSFNLYLTSLFLQYFVGVSIVIFVIIFQTEIRKYFELLGLVGTRQIKVGKITPKSPTITEIIQACVKMAQTKTGALIVIRGQDNLDLLVEGGTTVDSVISEELLLSIFDPHSVGHDGAIIIENNRISKIGVHLPLSNNFKLLKGFGTRHGAALGVSEQSDSLSIVVSEERGKISICKDGKIKVLENFSDLEKELDKYLQSKFKNQSTNMFRSLLTHNLWLKSTAILTSLVLWYFTAYKAGVLQKEYTVPVSFINLDNNVLIENYSPKEVVLTVSGRGSAAFSEDLGSHLKVELDASNLKDGINTIELNSKKITIPINLALVSYQPDTILLTAQSYVSISLPVTVKTSGSPAKGFSLNEITVTPRMVELWVPASATPPAEIFTENISINDLKESLVIPTTLQIPENTKLVKGEPEANVALTIE